MITVIVPVYNAAAGLERCLASISAQTHAGIEIVCVDDGSIDHSPAILAAHASSDTRVRVITQPNAGVSAARNRGLESAKGEWIMFVDADDRIDPDTCERALKAAGVYDTDLVLWPYTREKPDGSARPRPLMKGDWLFTGRELEKLHRRMIGPVDEELADPTALHSWGTVWGRLYRREVIGPTRFTDTRIVGSAEDALFNIELFDRVRRAFYLDRPMYHYLRRADSATARHNPGLNSGWERLYSMIEELVAGKPAEFGVALRNRVALGLIGQSLNEWRSGASRGDKIASLRGVISSPRYRAAIAGLPLGRLPLHWRFFFWAARRGDARLVLTLAGVIERLR